ncbi:MAG: septal ring lytic transglycosylase RlpA family protein, partial [Catalinimonas sp.]
MLGVLLLPFVAFAQQIGQTQEGMASYYADRFHGRITASGEPFDMEALTGAHKELPFNTLVEVTNLRNQH